MNKQNLSLFITISAVLVLFSCTKKSDPVSPTTGPYFPTVKTIIHDNCLSCHSSSGSWAGRPTAFDSDSAIAAAYESIKAAVNDPETITNHRMPQGGSLSSSNITTIVNWYNKGGKITD